MSLEKGLDIAEVNAKVTLNACGLQCPGPIKRVFEETKSLNEGEVLKVMARDPGFKKDISSWSEKRGNT